LGFLFAAGAILFVVGAVAATTLIWQYSKDLPEYSQLQDYEPPVMTRVHASDGALVAEYARERRLYLPIQAVPKRVIEAFLSAEDKNFYSHGGVDLTSIARAVVSNIEQLGTGRRPQGASTITQQVAKNFLVGSETSYTRKIKEALLALRMERAYSKDKILELYLNEIYLGLGAYGIAAASLIYFDKSVHELSVPEMAYLAALPKAPTSLHPFRAHDRAVERRNWVIDRMADNGYVTVEDAAKAKASPLRVTPRPTGAHVFAAEYFAEEVRREIHDRYGEKKLYEGGLSVRTTLNPQLQEIAQKVLTDGLVRFDEAQGWRGPVAQIEVNGDWGLKLADVRALSDIKWRLAAVLEVDDKTVKIGLQPGREPSGQLSKERVTGFISFDTMKWAKWATGPDKGKAIKGAKQVLNVGDVVYVEPYVAPKPNPKDKGSKEEAKPDQWRLHQVPEVGGAIAAMDPWTGRVLALVGGFSFDDSQFNRATQALRQPGSSFKPFVYAAALDNGYTPSSVVVDAPVEIDQGAGQGIWRPENYSRQFYGPQTLRFGLEQSRNVMTVRLAQDVGMPLIVEYAKRFGVYDDLPPYLSYALGAGETTLVRMLAGYSMFDNGGRKVKPTLIDRIQDRYGRTIFRHDDRECQGCASPKWAGQPEPELIDRREIVIDPMTAYQMTSMMEGVVQRGTGTRIRDVGRPVAGKTGTTNDEKDVWFIAFTPDLVVGVYLGYDRPRTLGRGVTGGQYAAPIVGDFLKTALADKPAQPFRVPPGIKLIRINAKSGFRAQAGDERVILEAFKPGTQPSDGYSMIGQTDEEGRPFGGGISPESDRAIMRGPGGLW
jgi:penicillin-binding protein 1A